MEKVSIFKITLLKIRLEKAKEELENFTDAYNYACNNGMDVDQLFPLSIGYALQSQVTKCAGDILEALEINRRYSKM